MTLVTETSGLFASNIGQKGKKGKKGSDLFASMFAGSAKLAKPTAKGQILPGPSILGGGEGNQKGGLFAHKGSRKALLQKLSMGQGLKAGMLDGAKAETLDAETLKKLTQLIQKIRNAKTDAGGEESAAALVTGAINKTGDADLDKLLKKLTGIVEALDGKKKTGTDLKADQFPTALQLYVKDPATGNMIELKGEKGKDVLEGLLSKGKKEVIHALFVKNPISGGLTPLSQMPDKIKQALAIITPKDGVPEPGGEAKTKGAAKKVQTGSSDTKAEPTAQTKAQSPKSGTAQVKTGSNPETAVKTKPDHSEAAVLLPKEATEGRDLKLDQIVASIGRKKLKGMAVNPANPNQPAAGQTGKEQGRKSSLKTNQTAKAAETPGVSPKTKSQNRPTQAPSSQPLGGPQLDPVEQLLAKEPGLFEKAGLKDMIKEIKTQVSPESEKRAPFQHARMVNPSSVKAEGDSKPVFRQGPKTADQPKPQITLKAQTEPKLKLEPKAELDSKVQTDPKVRIGSRVQMEPKTGTEPLTQGRKAQTEVQNTPLQKPDSAPPQKETLTQKQVPPTRINTGREPVHPATGMDTPQRAEHQVEPKITSGKSPELITPANGEHKKAALTPNDKPQQISQQAAAVQTKETARETQSSGQDRNLNLRAESGADQTRRGDKGNFSGGNQKHQDGKQGKQQTMPQDLQRARTPEAVEVRGQKVASTPSETNQTVLSNGQPGVPKKAKLKHGAGRAADRNKLTHMTATEKAAVQTRVQGPGPQAQTASSPENAAKSNPFEMGGIRQNMVAQKSTPSPTTHTTQRAGNDPAQTEQPAAAAEAKVETTAKPMTARPAQGPPQPMFRQVQNGIYQAFQLRPNQVSVKLSPDELGELTIEVSQEKDQIKAKIQTENQKVTSIIKEHQPELEQRLRDQGVDIESFDIHEQAEQGENGDDRRQARNEGGERAQGRASGGSNRDDAQPQEVTETAPVQNYTVESGRPFSFTV